MIVEVKEALGPVFVPMVVLWSVTAYFGLDILWKVWFERETALKEAEDSAAKLKRMANVAMVVGLFGQVWAVATGLGTVKGMGGMAGISELIKLLGVSLWSTLAGISVALLAEGFLIALMWGLGNKTEGEYETQAAAQNGAVGDTAGADGSGI